jgi:hypothetical protein
MRLACFALTTLVCGATAAPAFAQSNGESLDIAPYREKMRVLTDGKGHYLALLPFTYSDGPDTGWMFYGDGKTFYAQRRYGGGRNGNESFDTGFWEPRVAGGYKAQLSYKDKKYSLQCDERKTDLTPVDKAATQEMLGSAKFMKARWKRKAYALARDNSGTYYYVDKAREPEENKDFRVFRGPKGAIKPLKMTNVVSDVAGDIFVTKAGKLRLVLDKNETSWLEGSKVIKLTPLNIEENHVLVYNELGVYSGEALGTPCDDL